MALCKVARKNRLLTLASTQLYEITSCIAKFDSPKGSKGEPEMFLLLPITNTVQRWENNESPFRKNSEGTIGVCMDQLQTNLKLRTLSDAVVSELITKLFF